MRSLSFACLLGLLCSCALKAETGTPKANASDSNPDDAFYSQLAGEHLDRVVGSDLRQLASGASITRMQRPSTSVPVVSVPSYEMFNRDGTYLHGVENARASGTYDIADDMICSHRGVRTRCQMVFRALSGGFFVAYADMPDSIIAVNISHLP